MTVYEPLHNTSLSPRVKHCLGRYGVVLVYDLIRLSDDGFSHIKGIGQKQVDEIRAFVSDNQLARIDTGASWPSPTEVHQYKNRHEPSPIAVAMCKNNIHFQQAAQKHFFEIRKFQPSVKFDDFQRLIDDEIRFVIATYDCLYSKHMIENVDIHAIISRSEDSLRNAVHLFTMQMQT